MRHWILIVLITAVSLSLTSCRGMMQRARQKIGIEGIERIEPHSLSAVDLTLRVRNATAHRLVVKTAEFDVAYAGREVVRIRLADKVVIRRKTHGGVFTSWRLQVADPLAVYALVKKVRHHEIDKITVSYRVRGRGGIFPVEISGENVPLSKILNIFGGSIHQLKL